MSPRARWLMGVAAITQALALVVYTLRHRTAIEKLLFLDVGLSEPLARGIDLGGAGIACALTALALAWPRARALLWAWPAWGLVVALLSWQQGGAAFAHLSVLAWACRLSLPLALWAALTGREALAEQTLRWGVALTFAAHGVEAMGLHPHFIDLLMMAGHKLLGVWMPEQVAHLMLMLIGAIDLLLAGALLAGVRARWMVLYMAAWGGITALSRVVQWGPWGMEAALLRIAHFAAPLALWWLIRARSLGRPAPERADERGEAPPTHASVTGP